MFENVFMYVNALVIIKQYWSYQNLIEFNDCHLEEKWSNEKT